MEGRDEGEVDRLAQAKVAQLHVAVNIEEEIVGLDIPMDEPMLVDGLDAQDRLGNVEPRVGLGEDILRVVMAVIDGVCRGEPYPRTFLISKVITSPPGRYSINRYRYSSSWKL